MIQNLYRKLRFTYPTENFGKVSFEIDNDGYVELTYSNSAFVWDDINQSYTPDSISITANSYDTNNAKYTGSYT